MIALHDVGLTRRKQDERSLDFKRTLFDLASGKYRKPERATILRGISFDVEPGERLGIIGPNGAGKSTLLKVIAGIISPTSGTLEVGGVVAPLIELGAGFDPDLSVTDNVVVYGVLLGFDYREMRERVAEVIAFAQLEAYAEALFKTMSSGMAARLGFSVASSLEPDILLLDEVFAVGDESFRHRSQARIEALFERGTTSVIVSHDLNFIIETCSRVLCIIGGRLAFAGSPKAAVRYYLDTVYR